MDPVLPLYPHEAGYIEKHVVQHSRSGTPGVANLERLLYNKECPHGRALISLERWSCKEEAATGSCWASCCTIKFAACRSQQWMLGPVCCFRTPLSISTPNKPLSRSPSPGHFFGLAESSPTLGLVSTGGASGEEGHRILKPCLKWPHYPSSFFNEQLQYHHV